MKYFMVIFLSIFLVACSKPVESFKGPLLSVDKDLLVVDCAAAVYRDEDKSGVSSGVGWNCNVEINNNTEIVDENGNMVSIEKLKLLNETTFVEVILTKKADIGKKEESRNVTADKVIVLN